MLSKRTERFNLSGLLDLNSRTGVAFFGDKRATRLDQDTLRVTVAFQPIGKNTHVAGKSFASVKCDVNLLVTSPIQRLLIDPEGWRIPYKRPGPLLSLNCSERAPRTALRQSQNSISTDTDALLDSGGPRLPARTVDKLPICGFKPANVSLATSRDVAHDVRRVTRDRMDTVSFSLFVRI